MSFKNISALFPKTRIATLQATKNNSVILKTYRQSNIEQLGMYIVRFIHKNKIAKCRFFVVSGDGSALLGLPDIKLLDILKIICETMEDQQADKRFDFQTIQPSNNPSFDTNKAQQIRADNVNVESANTNMTDYFGSITNRAAGNKASPVLTQ